MSPVRERCRPTAPSDPLTSPSRARGCLAGEAGDGDERGGTGDQGGHGCVAGRRAAVEDGEGGEGGGGGGARGAAAGEGGAANRAQARHRHDAQLHGRAAGALAFPSLAPHTCFHCSLSLCGRLVMRCAQLHWGGLHVRSPCLAPLTCVHNSLSLSCDVLNSTGRLHVRSPCLPSLLTRVSTALCL